MTRLELAGQASAVLMAGVLSVLAGTARAQVFEIGADGVVTTYSGPAVVTSEGVRSLARSPENPAEGRSAIARALNLSAARHGVDPVLLSAVAKQESALRQNAMSPKGAVGVMQLMPATARQLGVDPSDMAANVDGGARYLAQLLRRYGGDAGTALAAYNAGPGAVARYGRAPPFAETQSYVKSVLSLWAAGAPTTAKRGM